MQAGQYRVALTLRKMKSIRLRIDRRNGNIMLSAPLGTSQAVLQQFLAGRLSWIENTLRKLQEIGFSKDEQLRDADSMWLEGKQYRFKILPNSLFNKISIEGDEVCMNCRKDCSPPQQEALLAGWYRVRLEQRAITLINKWVPIMGVAPGKLSIKLMKSRWGSCNIRSHNITLNLQLAKWSDYVLEYIIVHELAHLLEPSHNEVFKHIVSRFMPDWQARKALLAKGLNPLA